jgi:hypothetical protein
MKVYVYDENGEFNHEYEAQESPLEPGVFITPILSTNIAPKYDPTKETVFFVDKKWKKVPLTPVTENENG